MMNSARRAARPLRAVLGLGLAVGAGLASCANGDDPGFGGAAASSASAHGGMSGMANAGRSHGGMSLGGSTATGGALSMSGAGGTLVAGTGTGGGGGASGRAGGVGFGGTVGAAGTGGAGGAGGMTGFGSGGTMSVGGTSPMGGGGRAGGTSSGGKAGGGGTTSGGSGGSGGGVAPPPDIQGGMQAWGSRYWDCCKPACGWQAKVSGSPAKSCDKGGNPISDANAKNACESGGSAYACFSDRPWAVGDKLAYGYVAKNDTCGRCYHVQFTGTSHNGSQDMSSAGLVGKHMIVQVINNGNISADQMDFLIPGGGVGQLDACTNNQFSTSDLGATYGGFLAGCNGDHTCVKNKCQTVFAGKQDLLDGCDWFLNWFNGADNPNFTYAKIACPAEITQRSGLSDPG